MAQRQVDQDVGLHIIAEQGIPAAHTVLTPRHTSSHTHAAKAGKWVSDNVFDKACSDSLNAKSRHVQDACSQSKAAERRRARANGDREEEQGADCDCPAIDKRHAVLTEGR